MAAISDGQQPRYGEVQKQRCEGLEPVEMRQRRHGSFPHVFVWRGLEYRVQAVERCWTISRRGWDNQVEGHCFRARCREGTFDLFQNTRTGTWHMRRQVR